MNMDNIMFHLPDTQYKIIKVNRSCAFGDNYYSIALLKFVNKKNKNVLRIYEDCEGYGFNIREYIYDTVSMIRTIQNNENKKFERWSLDVEIMLDDNFKIINFDDRLSKEDAFKIREFVIDDD